MSRSIGRKLLIAARYREGGRRDYRSTIGKSDRLLGAEVEHSHRLITLLDALSEVEPPPSVLSRLFELALDASRPLWLRMRAAEVWTRHQPNNRRLWDALRALPASPSRADMCTRIASHVAPGLITPEDLKPALADFAREPDDHTMGRLIVLARKLVSPCTLLEQPLDQWMPSRSGAHQHVELHHFFDHVLARCVTASSNDPAKEVWRRVRNVMTYTRGLGEESRKALREWMRNDDSHPCSVIDQVLLQETSADAPWMPHNTFVEHFGWDYDAAILNHLMQRAQRERADAEYLLAVAVYVAARSTNAALFPQMHARTGL